MRLILIIAAITLTGCSTIKEYWPRPHDPVMFNNLVAVDIAVDKQDCEKPAWAEAQPAAEQLARYAEWRRDPQAANLRGLEKHIERMSAGGSKGFCEFGKKTAKQRIEAAKSAWEGR